MMGNNTHEMIEHRKGMWMMAFRQEICAHTHATRAALCLSVSLFSQISIFLSPSLSLPYPLLDGAMLMREGITKCSTILTSELNT